jgi:DNA-binding XRE family transcriptional regulator
MKSNILKAKEALEKKDLENTKLQEEITYRNIPPIYPPPGYRQPQQSVRQQYETINDKRQELCKLLKKERVTQGMTQRDLAKKSGMSQGTITRAEVHGWISITCLLTIAEALGKKITLI